jgi:hypothetical protein
MFYARMDGMGNEAAEIKARQPQGKVVQAQTQTKRQA